MNVLIYLIVLVVIYLIWIITIWISTKHLSCSRAFSKASLFEGEECELVEVVRNDKPFMIPWLRLESRISPHLQLGSQDNLHVSDERYYCSLFTLAPYQQIKRRHRVKFHHRGYYDLGNASLTVGDLLGVYQSQRNQRLSTPIYVYPKLLDQEELPVPISRITGELVRRRQLLQDPFLIRGIRPYQPGDPVRDIHWPATARTGEVHVRVHDYSAQTRLLVALNIQREDLQWNDYLPAEDEAITEYAISLAATICMQALRNGMAAGLAVNMPMDDNRKTTLLMPADGSVQEDVVLSACAKLKIVRTIKFPALLEQLTEHTGLDILILSRYDSDSIRMAMDKLRQCGNQVDFYQIGGVDT